jgi:hypothetical protein
MRQLWLVITGHMELVLWRAHAENINLEKGDVLKLENVVA